MNSRACHRFSAFVLSLPVPRSNHRGRRHRSLPWCARLVMVSLGWGLLGAGQAPGGEPEMRVVKAEQSGANLLENGDFERGAGSKLAGWVAAPNGCAAARG